MAATKAKRSRVLLRIGWTIKRQSGRLTSHLQRPGWPDYLVRLYDGEEIGPSIPARIAKRTGLKPSDL